MVGERAHILGYIVTGDSHSLDALKHLSEDIAQNAFRSASEGGVAGFELNDQRYEIRRNSDYTFVVLPAEGSGELFA